MSDQIPLTGGGDNLTPSCFTKWRNIAGFFIIGLVNQYAYVVMLSAALDIIHGLEKGGEANHTRNTTDSGASACTLLHNETTNATSYPPRDLCQQQGTSVILLADILPSAFINLIGPYFMHFFPYWIKIMSAVLFNHASFIIVALSSNEALVLFGVMCASIGCGFGEMTVLSLTSHYHRSTISGWSSGTGVAGVAGTLIYAGLRTFLSTKVTLLAQVFFPAIMFASYIFLLGDPAKLPSIQEGSKDEKNGNRNLQDLSNDEDRDSKDTTSLIENNSHPKKKIKKIKIFNKDEAKYWIGHVKYTPHLIMYMVPLFVVYIAEYSINQGFFELLYNANTHIGGYCMDQRTQYRWLQVAYQIGVFISRSSLPIIHIKHFWIMSLLQVVNFVFFFVASIYLFIPSFWLTFLIVVYEGLLGGGTYVNALYTVSKEVPDVHREYSMSVITMAANGGILTAAFISIFIHRYICEHFIQ